MAKSGKWMARVLRLADAGGALTHAIADGNDRAYCYKRALDRLALAAKRRKLGDEWGATRYAADAAEYRRAVASMPHTDESIEKITRIRNFVGL